MTIDPPILHLAGTPAVPIETLTTSQGTVYRFEGGLEAVAIVTRRETATSWDWSLRNAGTEPSLPVTRFCPFVLNLACRGSHAPVLHGSSGGIDGALFPPPSWVQWDKTFVTEGLAWGQSIGASSGGRSSNRELPFFIVENADRNSGIFVAIGWSGDWNLKGERIANVVTLEGGMSHLELALNPGETFSQPTILVGGYSGDAASGKRALRRHLREFEQPSLGGAAIPAFTFWNNYYGDRGCFTQRDALAEMPRAAAAGLEYFVIDGGWTGGGMDARFESLAPHIGTWRLSPEKFPDGWAPLRECASAHKLKLGIWFDLERAHTTSEAYRDHPHLFAEGAAWDGVHLLRLDLDEAREWALDTMIRVVQELGAQWLRFDFNMDPAPYWEQCDGPQRRGSTEIRHLENLYRLWDDMRAKFPDLVIENCASGGRRIDLQTVRRTHTDWISDHSQSDAIIRFHLHGACNWLPLNHLGTSMAHAFLEPNRGVDWTQPLPAAAYLSHFGGTFSVSDRLLPLTDEAMATLARVVAHFRATAPCFAGEVFPLGQQSKTLRGPCGLAGVDTRTGQRAVLFFGGREEAKVKAGPAFATLLDEEPLWGDSGSDEFPPAWLWADTATNPNFTS